MARKTYQLTDETFRVLSADHAAIAREMECDPSYINKIKNGAELDRYAFFRELFRAACHTSAPAEIWLYDLTGIYLTTRRLKLVPSDLTQIVMRKIDGDGAILKEILESTKDDHLDKAECYRIMAKLAANQTAIRQIEEIVSTRLAELNEQEKREEKAA